MNNSKDASKLSDKERSSEMKTEDLFSAHDFDIKIDLDVPLPSKIHLFLYPFFFYFTSNIN